MTNVQPLITYKQMEVLTGKSRKSLWRWFAKDGTFPKPLTRNGRAIGWTEQQYQNWLAQLEGANHE